MNGKVNTRHIRIRPWEQFEDNHFLRLTCAQDRAPAHRSYLVRDLLLEMSQDRVISQGNDTKCSLVHRISLCNFFLWGFVKGRVFTTLSASMEDLRDRIVDEFANLKESPEMIERAVMDMRRCIEPCVERGGRHVEGH